MSRRLIQFRRLKKASSGETLQNLIQCHRTASDKNGRVITRPINSEKAQKIAAQLHATKAKL